MSFIKYSNGSLLSFGIFLLSALINKYHVEYLIIGGTAVAFYGHSRISTRQNGEPLEKHDLDFWYNPIYENYYKLINALKEIGFDISKIDNEPAVPKESFFRHEFDDFKIDFLPKVKGLESFAESYNKRENKTLQGIEVSLISYKDLIICKKTSSRPKDLDDIRQLKYKRTPNSV